MVHFYLEQENNITQDQICRGAGAERLQHRSAPFGRSSRSLALSLSRSLALSLSLSLTYTHTDTQHTN